MNRRDFLFGLSSCLLFSFINKVANHLKLNMPEGLGKHTLNELYHYKMSDLYPVKMGASIQTIKKHRWYLPFVGK
jgi:hypothetical protein